MRSALAVFRVAFAVACLLIPFAAAGCGSTAAGRDVVRGLGERTDVSVVTTDRVDRDGEVVLAGGIDLADFRANPSPPSAPGTT
jgi:hypothetical protein